MTCKIIKETEIPGAVLPSEFDETGTVTMTHRVDRGVCGRLRSNHDALQR